MELKYGWYAPKYVWECLDAKFEFQNEVHRSMLHNVLQKYNTKCKNQEAGYQFENMVTQQYNDFIKKYKKK